MKALKMENNNYITKEFYDANMAEFRETVKEMIRAADARCDRAVAEIRAEGAQMRAENAQMRADFAKLLADVQGNQVRLDNMDKRIDNMERSQEKFFRNFSIAAGVVTLFLTGLQVFVAVITLIK